MQPQIVWLAENITTRTWLRAVLKILMDALLSVTWIVGAPLLLLIKYKLQQKDQ